MRLTTSLQRCLRFLAAAGIAAGCAGTQAASLVAYTEESPPYHYMDKGKVVGVTADLLRAACERARLSCRIELLPWARASALARLTPNSILFSLVRTPEREASYIWLSAIATEALWVYGRPDSPPVHSIADLNQVRVGAINGSASSAILRAAGVAPAAIDLANSSEGNLRKFASHRVDYIVTTDSRLQRQKALQPLPFKVSKALQVGDAVTYFAMHPQSSAEIVKPLRSALEELRQSKAFKDRFNGAGAECSSECRSQNPGS